MAVFGVSIRLVVQPLSAVGRLHPGNG
jgi:hypothetical protein